MCMSVLRKLQQKDSILGAFCCEFYKSATEWAAMPAFCCIDNALLQVATVSWDNVLLQVYLRQAES